MTDDLTKDQQLLLWELFAAGGAKLQGALFKKAGPKVVGPLVAGRHLRVAKRGRANLIELQDDGWRWIADSEPFPVLPGEKRVGAERRLLGSLVTSLKRYAAAEGLQIQDLFRSAEPHGGGEKPAAPAAGPKGGKARTRRKEPRGPATGADAGPADVEARIRSAFFGIAGRPARDNVRLSALRAALADVPRKEVDRALLAMRRSGAANLMNLDNPRDVAAEAEAALTSGHNTFHVIRIDA